MYKNIDDKLKVLAGILAFTGITVGVIWLLMTFSELQDTYFDDKNIYYSRIFTRLH